MEFQCCGTSAHCGFDPMTKAMSIQTLCRQTSVCERLDVCHTKKSSRCAQLLPESSAPLLFVSNFSLWLNGSFVFEIARMRSEEHTSELQSLMRISYAVSCLQIKKPNLLTT